MTFKEIRETKGYSLQKIANKLSMTRNAIWRFEQGLSKSGKILAYYLAIATDEQVIELIKQFKNQNNVK